MRAIQALLIIVFTMLCLQLYFYLEDKCYEIIPPVPLADDEYIYYLTFLKEYKDKQGLKWYYSKTGGKKCLS